MLQASTPAVAEPIDRTKEVVCRRIEVTGSLARKEKVCKTRGEWRRLADAGNNVARQIVEHSTSRPAGGP
ncbi:MAG: hypothetical protein DI569_02435 [Sphingopyxis macrogoltabida]|uniref:Uncharacterized protein n=1 Tax=Sphingopyxis macrogoltabida TaxID=33050 RepID=A0A2W5L7I7_SPHMC|nr:MAG: hypothetical protein DI569_02435 [Sphingopyxis macrogoltabida]